MEHHEILESQKKMIEFCKDAGKIRIVQAITHHARRWRLYAGFMGEATSPICSGETKRFTFMFEGAQFKVYLKGFFGTWEKPKPVPPYPGALEKEAAFENMIYATQVSERTGDTHVLYVDWRFVELVNVFLNELRRLIHDIRAEAMQAAVKAKEDGQVFTLFEDEDEESPRGSENGK